MEIKLGSLGSASALSVVKFVLVAVLAGYVYFIRSSNITLSEKVSSLGDQLSSMSAKVVEQDRQISLIRDEATKANKQKQSNTKEGEELQVEIKKSVAKDSASVSIVPSDSFDRLRKQVDSIRSGETSTN